MIFERETVIGCILLPLLTCVLHAADFEPSTASLDELLRHAQRYGTTEAKRELKRLARDEIFARKGEALRYLIEHIHTRNAWAGILVSQMIQRFDGADAVPALAACLDSERQETRKFAVYYLGFYDVPDYADRVLVMLDDDYVAGAAIRSLGKWHVRKATPAIASFLASDKERRRIVAANALRDIGDPRAIPFLVKALDDPYFTVRKSVARALVSLGKPAELALLDALSSADGYVLREIIRSLGAMKSRRAIRRLRRLLDHNDWGVRADTAAALSAISERRSRRWIKGTRADGLTDMSGPRVFPPL